MSDTNLTKNIKPNVYFLNGLKYGQRYIDSSIVKLDTIPTNGLKEIRQFNELYYKGFGRMLLPNTDTINNVMKVRTYREIESIYKTFQGDSLVSRSISNNFWYVIGSKKTLILIPIVFFELK